MLSYRKPAVLPLNPIVELIVCEYKLFLFTVVFLVKDLPALAIIVSHLLCGCGRALTRWHRLEVNVVFKLKQEFVKILDVLVVLNLGGCISDLVKEELHLPVASKDVLLEVIFVKLLKDEAALQLLLRVKDTFDQEDPNLLDPADNCLPDPCVVLNNGVEHLPVLCGPLGICDGNFLSLSPLCPCVLPKVLPDLLVASLGEVDGGRAEGERIVPKNLATVRLVEIVVLWPVQVSTLHKQVVVLRVVPSRPLVGDQRSQVLQQPVPDPVHELFDALVENRV